MLNKELLMAGITVKEPHIILTVGYDGGIRAYTYGYTRIYSVSSNNVPSNCPKLQYAITGRNKRLGGTKEALYA